MTLQHLRSSTANKRPDPTAMADGQIALNTAAASPGLFYKDSAGNLVKAGPVHVGSTAPNVSPASGGTAGNSTGESWLDTSGSNPLLKVWNGSSWQTVQPVASGTVVSTADTGSVTSTMIANGTIVDADVNASAAIAGTKISPDFGSQNVTTTGTVTGASLNPTSSTVPTNGVYLPAANSVAISTNGSGRLFVDSTGRVGVNNSGPSFVLDISGGAGTGVRYQNTTNSVANYFGADSVSAQIGSTTNHPLAFLTNATERMRLTSTGLGIGTSSPNDKLDISTGNIRLTDGYTLQWGGTSTFINGYNAGILQLCTGSTPRLYINSSGNVGIGTTSPAYPLDVVQQTSDDSFALQLRGYTTGADGTRTVGVRTVSSNAGDWANLRFDASSFVFRHQGTTERARIDSSGRLLVGTSSSSAEAKFIVQGGTTASGGAMNIQRSLTTASAGSTIGSISFTNSANNVGAIISADGDGTWNAGTSHPTLLKFSTTADGASSPTERMRIASGGNIFFNKTDYDTATPGVRIDAGGQTAITMASNTVLALNRTTNDGTLVNFLQDNVSEGSISVSGTTVSYNGAHLSRWSQLPSGADRTEILRGSVLSNIDEMCEWGEEDNEQLNRMKVSDVEGDKNVSGVFQAWDDDDDTYTNDFYCAMTGDFIIRIGAGVTVERGDLLMSAGDGTAKPQTDDLVRSCTVAKVTSTNVSCTYPDGSYCVPCVLMAC